MRDADATDAVPLSAEPRAFFAPRPVRVVLAGLALAGGLLALSAVFSSTSASADEAHPDGHSLLGSVVSGVAGTVDRLGGGVSDLTSTVDTTVRAVVTPVAGALPAPVSKVVQAVEPVTGLVTSTLKSGPVGHLVAPVAGTLDHIVGAVPVVGTLLGDNPISTITNPVTGIVDSTVGSAAGTVGAAVGTLGTPSSTAPSVPGTPGTGEPGTNPTDPSGSTGSWPVVTPVLGTGGPATTVGGWSTAAQVAADYSPASFGNDVAVGAASPAGSGTVPLGSPTGIPNGQHDAAVAAPGASSGGSGSGAAGAGSVADTARGGTPTTLNSSLSGLPGADVLPSSPTSDHDISPD